jgi:hypothetical protein
VRTFVCFADLAAAPRPRRPNTARGWPFEQHASDAGAEPFEVRVPPLAMRPLCDGRWVHACGGALARAARCAAGIAAGCRGCRLHDVAVRAARCFMLQGVGVQIQSRVACCVLQVACCVLQLVACCARLPLARLTHRAIIASHVLQVLDARTVWA